MGGDRLQILVFLEVNSIKTRPMWINFLWNLTKLVGMLEDGQREALVLVPFSRQEMGTKATGRKKRVATRSFMYRKHVLSLCFGFSIHTIAGSKVK